MHGWLIYDSAGAQKNRWFIERLRILGGWRGLSLEPKTDDEALFDGATPDFAIVRTIRPALNRALEEAGVRVFNNAETARIACDKWATYVACKEWGIPVLPTVEEWSEDFGLPCIVKTVDGHGGTEVYRVTSAREYQTIRKRYKDRRTIAQKQNRVLGEDMRIYALGGEIVAGVMRSSERDFRSNYSLGGSVCLREADDTQRAIVKALYEKLRFDFVGIDFLPDGYGGWILNEIEDPVGSRMLYKLTSDIDIALKYVEYIAKTLRG